jgi:hypothetical protein
MQIQSGRYTNLDGVFLLPLKAMQVWQSNIIFRNTWLCIPDNTAIISETLLHSSSHWLTLWFITRDSNKYQHFRAFVSSPRSWLLAKRIMVKNRQFATFKTPCILWIYSKGKAIPLQALTGPEGSRRLRPTDLETVSKVVSPMHRPPLPRENIPGTHFC